jgi:hypothetical protein
MLTPTTVPGVPFYVAAGSIIVAEEDGPGTAVVIGIQRLKVRENIREVFRRKAEANTVEGNVSSPPPVVFPDKPDRVRKKA